MRNVVMCNQQIKDECNKCGFLGDSWLFPRRITDNTASYFDQRVDVTFLEHSQQWAFLNLWETGFSLKTKLFGLFAQNKLFGKF